MTTKSSAVVAGNTAFATDLNNLRDDVLGVIEPVLAFELDGNSDLEPITGTFKDGNWELDADGNIVPSSGAALSNGQFTFDPAAGALVPESTTLPSAPRYFSLTENLVYNTTSPTAFPATQVLDLSAYVGARRALVILRGSAPSGSRSVAFCPSDEPNADVSRQAVAMGGNCLFSNNAGGYSYAIVMTGTDGKLVWGGFTADTWTIYLVAILT